MVVNEPARFKKSGKKLPVFVKEFYKPKTSFMRNTPRLFCNHSAAKSAPDANPILE
jgi:hypothetical protein